MKEIKVRRQGEMAEKHDIMWLRYNLYIDKLADRRKE
jgi:hypothetical protein